MSDEELGDKTRNNKTSKMASLENLLLGGKRKFAVIGALFVGLLSGWYWLCHHNVIRDSVTTWKVLSKMDTVGAETKVVVNSWQECIYISKSSVNGVVIYDNPDADEHVDRIKTDYEIFDRAKDYDKFPEKFDKADILYKEEERRFRDLLAKHGIILKNCAICGIDDVKCDEGQFHVCWPKYKEDQELEKKSDNN